MKMDVEYFRTLFDYCYWARDRVLKAMEGMSDEEYAKPNGFTYGSIRGILSHALGGEQLWLARFVGDDSAAIVSEADLPTLASLTQRWREEESKMRAFLGGLEEAALERDVTMRRRSGEELRLRLWQLLAHVANHTTQHRSEAAEALTMVGRSPGGLDYMGYVLEKGQ